MKKIIFIGIVMMILLAVSVSGVVDDDTEHYWNFDESSGDLIDRVASLDGTNTGVNYEQSPVAPNSQYSYEYDGSGTGDKTYLGNVFTFPTTDWTIDGWFKTSPDANNKRVFSFRQSGQPTYVFCNIDSDAGGNQLRCLLMDGSNQITLETSGTYDDGNAHYFALTYNSSGDDMFLIVDNNTEKIQDMSADWDGLSNVPFYIGFEAGTTLEFHGNLDEFGFYNKTFLAEDVEQRYGGGDYPFPEPPPNVTNVTTSTIRLIDFNTQQSIDNFTIFLSTITERQKQNVTLSYPLNMDNKDKVGDTSLTTVNGGPTATTDDYGRGYYYSDIGNDYYSISDGLHSNDTDVWIGVHFRPEKTFESQGSEKSLVMGDYWYLPIFGTTTVLTFKSVCSGTISSQYTLGTGYSEDVHAFGYWNSTSRTTYLFVNGTLVDSDTHTKNPCSENPLNRLGNYNFNGTIYKASMGTTIPNGFTIEEFANFLKDNYLFYEDISTTNGSIKISSGYGDADILFFNVSSDNETIAHFNRTYTEYNSSFNITGETWQSELYIYAKDLYTNETIQHFNVTINNTKNISQGNRTHHLLPAGNFTYNARAEGYADNVTGLAVMNPLEIQNLTIYFDRDVMNEITFINKQNGNPIPNGNITIVYPTGETLYLTSNSSGEVNFSFILQGQEIFGNYTITFGTLEGFNTPVTFITEINSSTAPVTETYEISITSIQINIFDRETGSVFDFQEVEVVMLDQFNKTTSNGTLPIINQSIVTGTYIVQVYSNGYQTEQQQFDYVSQENITLNFYLLNLTGVNTGTLFASVIDEFYRIIQDATVSLLEYDSVTKSFIQVSECQSNVNGECQFAIELNEKTYFLRATKIIQEQGYTTETTSEIINTDNEVRELFLRLSNPFTIPEWDNVVLDISESFENNISNINVSYYTLDGDTITVCLEYFLVETTTKTSIYKQCVTSSSGFLTRSALLNRSLSYEAQVYLSSDKILQDVFDYPSTFDFPELFNSNNYARPFVLFLWIALISVSFYMKNATLLALGVCVLSWFEVALFPNLLIISGSVLKTLIGAGLFFITRKRQDNI